MADDRAARGVHGQQVPGAVDHGELGRVIGGNGGGSGPATCDRDIGRVEDQWKPEAREPGDDDDDDQDERDGRHPRPSSTRLDGLDRHAEVGFVLEAIGHPVDHTPGVGFGIEAAWRDGGTLAAPHGFDGPM